eukprot:scaffold39339_cov62-Phaeocystis_antarctica.AAC.5
MELGETPTLRTTHARCAYSFIRVHAHGYNYCALPVSDSGSFLCLSSERNRHELVAGASQVRQLRPRVGDRVVGLH